MTKLLASAVYLFARNRGEWAKLIDDPGKIPAAIEELLRFDNPVQYDVRRSMRDVELHGVTIPAGKPVFLMLASANRDPEVFSDPDVFDIRRAADVPHLGLGVGAHYCLGAALARLELRSLFAAVAENTPGMHLAGAPEPGLRSLRGPFEPDPRSPNGALEH